MQNSNPQNLPHLPVPKLQQTLEKYIKTVEPHLAPKELERTKSIIKDFENGIGRKLQELLILKAKDTENWLAEWWLNVAYLEYRDPVVVYSSPGLVFPFQHFENESDRLLYTAKLILAAVDYKLLIDRFVRYCRLNFKDATNASDEPLLCYVSYSFTSDVIMSIHSL